MITKLPDKWRVFVHSLDDFKEYALFKGYDISGQWLEESRDYWLYSEIIPGLVNPKYVSGTIYEQYTEISFQEFKKFIKLPIPDEDNSNLVKILNNLNIT